MPTSAVQLASGQEVVSDFLLGADSTIGDLAQVVNLQSPPLGVFCCRPRATAWRTP